MWIKLFLLFFVFSFLFKTDHSFDQDLGRHLKLGEIIWQTKEVPQTNLLSYTNPDFTFINTHWLFEVIVYLISQTTGLQALLFIKIAIFLTAVYLILKVIPKDKKALLLPLGFIFFHVLRERTELRPEIFSFLFTALSYFILEKYLNKPTKLIYLLPAVQLIWINTHIYFFVGLLLQVIFLIHLSYKYLRFNLGCYKLKLLGVFFALSVIVSLMSPSGLTGFLYPLNVTKNYGYTIVENQTILLLESIGFKDPNFLFAKISIAIILLSLIVAFLRRKFEVKNILLVLFGAVLSLMNVRSFPYLIFLSFPAVLGNFGSVRQNAATKFLAAFFGLLLLIESFFYLNGDYYRYKDMGNKVSLKFEESGKKALDFVINNNLPSPIFNNFDIGSYISYRGYPGYLVFVDGRPEAYPKDFFQQIYIPMQTDPVKFKEIDQQYRFKTIIFSHTDQTPWGKSFLTSIVKNPDWKIVYLDDFMIVLVKSEVLASQDPTLQVDLSKLDPSFSNFDSHVSYLRLSLFLAQTGNTESAEKFAKKALLLFPKSPLGNNLFGIQVQNKFFW